MVVYLRLQVSGEVSLRWNRCLKRFKLFLELSKSSFSCQCSFSSVSYLCEVDVFEHPRFRDEFSHLVNGRLFATGSLGVKSHFDGINV